MERGYLFIRGSEAHGAANWWSTEKPGYHNVWGFPKLPKEYIMIMKSTTKENSIKQGFRCPKCKIIIFNYGEEKENNTEEE